MIRKIKSKDNNVNIIWDDTSSVAKVFVKNQETAVQLSGINPRLFGKGTKFRVGVYQSLSNIADSLARVSKYLDSNPAGTISVLQYGDLPDNMSGSYENYGGSVVVDPNKYPSHHRQYHGMKVYKDAMRDNTLLHELTHSQDFASKDPDMAEVVANQRTMRYLNDRISETPLNMEKDMYKILKADDLKLYNNYWKRVGENQ